MSTARQKALLVEFAAKASPHYRVYLKVGQWLNTRETGRGYPIYIICESRDKEDRIVREIARCTYDYTIKTKFESLDAELQRLLAERTGK